MQKKTPLVLVILDGWGYKESTTDNAIAQAHTPHWDAWWKSRPHRLLEASGQYVGLPDHQMGNSDVGHKHIGAGRIMYQDFSRINHAIASGEFFKNPALLQLINQLKANNKTLHLMGLLSPGGVHSHEDHLLAILKLCHQQHCNNICLHLFLDGRDTPPRSALESIKKLQHHLQTYSVARIASLSGRYFAMDRDLRWERTEAVYRLLTEAESPRHFVSAEEAISTFYEENTTDEFIPPSIIGDRQAITDGDAVFFFNFRADRARQLTQAFLNAEDLGFARRKRPQLGHFVSMTQYSKDLASGCVFTPLTIKNSLGEVIASAGLRQLRIAETEKYAHVTYFFNGGSEQIFAHEDRILIPSPKVATYDLCPQMSALALTQTLTEAIERETYDVIICNYANADMVGHSGNFEATVKAIECLDSCIQDIWQAVEKKDGKMLITADHGNAETMFDASSGQSHTAHTSQPVPLVFLSHEDWQFKETQGSLIDIATTVLTLLDLEIPNEMNGQALLVKQHAH